MEEKNLDLLDRILKALTARRKKRMGLISTDNPDYEAVSEIKASLGALEVSLEALEAAHTQHKSKLTSANEKIKSADIERVFKMKDTISSLREGFGTEQLGELELDQPNALGDTPLHVSTRLNYNEVTRQLLENGANPNVENRNGDRPLHIICSKNDIQLATCVIKNNGRLPKNKAGETPALEKLLLDRDEEEVVKLVDAIGESNYRKEILDEILKKKNILFRLVEEDKPEILSIVLKKLSKAEQKEYVSLVRDMKDGNTCLHLACSRKSLKCASMLLENGAKFKTNTTGHLPEISVFFTKEHDNQITPALVDGIVEKVKAKQLRYYTAIKLLIPGEGEGRKLHFQLASGENWKLMTQWKDGKKKIDFSKLVPRMTVSGLHKMVEVAREGHWETEMVSSLLFAEDKDGTIFLSRLDLSAQQEVAQWNPQRIYQIVHKISDDLLQWIIHQANKGDWHKEELADVVCNKSSDKKPPISMRSVDMQKQLAELNRSKTCQIVPWLGRELQRWMLEGNWDQEMVSRYLAREVKEGELVVSARMSYPLGQLSKKA